MSKLAIDGGTPIRQTPMPRRNLFGQEEKAAATALFDLSIESGDAFVGDLAMNRPPLRFSPGLPIFADQPSDVIKSWKTLLALGAKMVYPAHGKPFPSSIIARKINY